MDEIVRETVDALIAERLKRKEFLCAAFIEETGLRPSEAVLVEERTADGFGFRWYFERRTTGES